MYLSNQQHSKLRTLLMDFEIPYRVYVAIEILNTYTTAEDFENAVMSKTHLCGQFDSFNTFSSEFGKIKTHAKKIYSLLKNVEKSAGNVIQKDEIDVPLISQINILVLIFNELFSTYISRFYDTISFWDKAGKFHFARNKLSHPGCKTLEKSDMDYALEFVNISNRFLREIHNEYYWIESAENIEKQLESLATSTFSIPIEITNLTEMPFAESKLVCREKEMSDIKRFVYGKEGALRKKSSYCLFGYGGVGKTVLVLETVKDIIRDIVDGTTLNGYCPSFILFFSAKKVELTISNTSGRIEKIMLKNTFSDFETLRDGIFSYLHINDFTSFNKTGLIIIDNFETLSQDERNKIREYIEYESPSQIQYIITSRNEELFSERKCLSGFNDLESCKQFILEYLSENDLDLQLTSEEMGALLEISKGNTLVLVLSIKRLAHKFDTITGLKADMSQTATVKK